MMCRRLIVSAVVVLVLGVVRAGFAADPTDPNLIGWWTLDAGLGATAVDSSGKGHDGRFVSEPLWTDGFSGAALEFDGVDDYVLCAERSGTQPGVYPQDLMPSGGFTVSCWLKLHTFAYFSSFVGNGMDTGDDECGFFLYNYGWNDENGRDFGLAIRTEAGMFYVETPNTYDTGTWYHLAATYDGQSVRIYVNGVLAAGPQAVGGPMRWISQVSGNYPERFAIGVWLDPGYDLWVDGVIDEVRYYNRAMAQTEVRNLAFQPKAHAPDPPDGATSVTAPLLRWTAGSSAVLHNVYLGTGPELGPADLVGPRLSAVMYYHVPGLEPGGTYFWRVDEIEKDGVTIHTGDLWTFTAQALTAYRPTPADGAVDVSPAPVLTWLPGTAAAGHHIYFSDSFADVNSGAPAADRGTSEEASFTPGELDPAATYFWRVDESAAGGAIKTGAVWTFTTHLPIDDFESYTDEEGSRIYQTWIDGYADQSSGSTVGHIDAPFAEQTIVHGGRQSMPLDYNNVKPPYFSEAEREFAPVADWTINDVNTLVLNVRGRVTNQPTLLYLTVEDSSGKAGTVVYGEPAFASTAKWIEWRIPFREFTAAGVNMARVKKLYIGLGDRNDPKPGSAGTIFIDDIRAVRPAAIK